MSYSLCGLPMEDAPTVIDVVREVFEEDLGPDLIDRVSRAPHSLLHSFRERHREFAVESRAPVVPHHYLRPYIPVTYLRADALRRGLKLQFWGPEFDDIEAIGEAANAIQHHLLYCHSVAIDNPLAGLLDYFTFNLTDQFTWARARLINFLIFLSYMKPLIKAGILVLVEDKYMDGYQGPWPPTVVRYEEYETVTGLADFSDLERNFGPVPADVRQTLMDIALTCIGVTQIADRFHASKPDYYFPFLYFLDAFREVVGRTADLAPRRFSERETTLLSHLINTSIPNLSSLSPQDIVSVRLNDEAFAGWRAHLSKALERAGNLDPRLLNQETETLRVIQEEIVHEQHILETQLEGSRFLTAARDGMRVFTVGALASLAVFPLQSPTVPVATSAAAGAIEFIWSYLDLAQSEAEKALLHHFLLMKPEIVDA